MEKALRVEIILSESEIEELIQLLEDNEATGYTVFQELIGKGGRGVQDGLGLTNAFQNCMLLWICEPREFEQLIDQIRELLKSSGGLCMTSEVQIMKH